MSHARDIPAILARDEELAMELGGGRLHVERQLPFLLVHRSAGEGAERGLAWILGSEASVLLGPDNATVIEVANTVVRSLREVFGSVLVIELWAGPPAEASGDELAPARFRIVHAPHEASQRTVDALAAALSALSLRGRRVEVEREPSERVRAPGREDLALDSSVHHLGLEVTPLWHWAPGDIDYSDVKRAFRLLLGPALREAVRAHAVQLEEPSSGAAPPVSVHDFGRSRVSAEAQRVDASLAAISDRFEWLRTLTPVGVERVWDRFEQSGFEAEPELHYRPLRIDPDPLRRELINIPIETVPDPTIEALLREKQGEIDRRLSMLALRGTKGFLYGSLQLYGEVDASLRADAENVLVAVDASPPTDEGEGEKLDVEAVKARAEAELAFYRADCPDFPDAVEIGDDIAAGLMVSQGRLLLARGLTLPVHRLEALLQHEVGTHVVTHYNGTCQPIRQFASGLASYDALQEGLGVFAEYVAGGLTAARMRVVALRVVAVAALTSGATFVDTFRELRDRGAPDRDAFDVTLRVFRGGGLTKDALYLRGLRDVLAYLAEGQELEPLYLGKIALRHVPMVQELRLRRVLEAPRVLPRILRESIYRDRIQAARELGPADLLMERP